MHLHLYINLLLDPLEFELGKLEPTHPPSNHFKDYQDPHQFQTKINKI